MVTDPQANRIIIFDTTLRDGEQSPGATMNLAEKLEIARALAELGVDVIEAGFPAASPGDFETVQRIAASNFGPVIAGLARCSAGDVAAAAKALEPAHKKRIHVFLATSAIHREHKLKMAKEEIVRRTIEGVRLACEHTDDVEFSPEDAARTELDFLAEVVEAAIGAGATTINIPDTVGYAVPAQMGAVIRYLKEHVSNINKAILSVHCHNDLGLAVANSIAAIEAGARQVECTINGIGERAGNCALEEIVMALKVRHDYFGFDTGINTPKLFRTSELVAGITGMRPQRNKAIVGKNAFAHEAGIHQHGVLQNAETYEIMKPQDVGQSHTEVVLGKHSGRHALRARLEEMGYQLSDEVLQKVFEEFKRLADKKKDIYDADLAALAKGQTESSSWAWELIALSANAGSGATPVAAVKLRHIDGHEVLEAASGDGPIESSFRAIERITGIELVLRDFQIRGVTVGKEAQGEAVIEVEYNGGLLRGRGISTDIIEASAKAFLSVVNKILAQGDAPNMPRPHAP